MRTPSSVSSPLLEESPAVDMKLIWLLTITAGAAVANLYYSQPLLADIAQSFSLSASQAGFLGTLAQIGYGLGLLLIVPLGDSKQRRTLLTLLLVLEAVALIGVASSLSVAWIAIASLAVGLLTVVPQVIVPFAASLAPDETRARIVGTILSGMLVGILLARVVSGFIGEIFGWRAMYAIAAVLMLVLALILWRVVPTQPTGGTLSYPQLLRSIWTLVRTEPAIRQVSLFGALNFGAFNVLWITLAFFLRTPPYHFDSAVVGLFGLLGVAGALAAPQVGRLADRTRNPRITIGVGLALDLVAFIIFWLFGTALWGVIVGVILLDLGVQTTITSCQAIVQNLRPQARSRLNTIFMTSYFLGAALGSTLGSSAWSLSGWGGVCVVGVVLPSVALVAFLLTSRRAPALATQS